MKVATYQYSLLYYHIVSYKALLELGKLKNSRVFLYSISSFLPQWQDAGYHTLLGNEIQVISPGNKKRESWWKLCCRLWQILELDSPDVVGIAGYATPFALTSLAWCRLHHRGAICLNDMTEWNKNRKWWIEKLKKIILSQFDSGFVAGKPQIAYLNKLGMPLEHITSKYYVTDNNFYALEALKARTASDDLVNQLNLPKNFFFTASRLIPIKNLETIISAYALYKSELGSEAWKLVIAGKGSSEKDLCKLIDDLNLADHVLLIGYQNYEQLATLYGLAKAFILASYREPWGLVINEAMAAGLPVMVSNVCGCVQDLIIEGKTGLTFNPYNIYELKLLMKNVSKGQINSEELGLQAQKHIAAFSPDDYASNFFKAAKIAIEVAEKRQTWSLIKFSNFIRETYQRLLRIVLKK